MQGDRPIRILHLEDEACDAEMVRIALDSGELSCDVQPVSTREAFVAALDAATPDLILSDFGLPGFSGAAALVIARERVPHVPFIFVSGTIGEEVAIETLRGGATDYVLKHRLSRLGPAVLRAIDEADERRKRRSAETMLENEREFLRTVLESIDAAVMAYSPEGQLRLLNRAARELHDLPHEPDAPLPAIEELPLFESDGTTPVDPGMAPHRRALRGEQVSTTPLVVPSLQGPPRTVLASSQPILDPGGRMLGAVVVEHDITQRKELEEQLHQSQKMEAIGRLAGGVAHDFNNLLNVILGYAELSLGDLPADGRLRSKIEQITYAGERAASLTRQLLAFSRKQVAEPKILDLNHVLGEFEKMLRRLIGADIEIVTRKAEGIGRVKADAGQIEQIILNLAVNARDAMPGGGVLTIETSSHDPEERGARVGRSVVLSVRDSGVGMDARTQSRIFEPFFTTKPEGKGTGLGLATVYGIVNAAGGHIEVASEVGRGTTFRILLPEVSLPADASDADESVPPARGSETVLLLEDEDTLRSLIVESLRELGYSVLEAGSVREAEALSRSHVGAIDLLLTDVMLPGGSGRRAAEQLSSARPSMRILFMSGHADAEVFPHGVGGRGVAFLQKPFALRALGRKIREVLEAAPAPDAEVPALDLPPILG